MPRSLSLLLASAFVVACGAANESATEGDPATDPGTTPENTPSTGAQAGDGSTRPDARAPTDGGAADAEAPADAETPEDAGPPEDDAATPPPPTDSGVVDSGPPVVNCGTANPAKGFIASVSVTVGGVARTYALTVPASYVSTKRYPLVVGFHGDGGNGAGYRSAFPIEAQAGANAIFAWPNGTNNHRGHSFDQFNSPPAANPDVAFFDAMTAAIKRTYCIDAARVYVHGSSGGAYFTNQLARWRNSAIRAIAPQSGGGPFGNGASDFDPATGSLKLTGPMAALIVHGQADTAVVPAEGLKSLAYWRLANGSTAGDTATTPTPCRKQNGGTKRLVYCSIPGLGHTGWSGAPAAIWQFFAAN
jgi:polyhydroxybutyrate depolymerase